MRHSRLPHWKEREEEAKAKKKAKKKEEEGLPHSTAGQWSYGQLRAVLGPPRRPAGGVHGRVPQPFRPPAVLCAAPLQKHRW